MQFTVSWELNSHKLVVLNLSADCFIVYQNVCTVEELERDLISQRNIVPIAPPPGLSKPSSVIRLEDIERDLTTSKPGVGTTSSFPVVTLGLGQGQPQPSRFTPQVRQPNIWVSKILNCLGLLKQWCSEFEILFKVMAQQHQYIKPTVEYDPEPFNFSLHTHSLFPYDPFLYYIPIFVSGF